MIMISSMANVFLEGKLALALEIVCHFCRLACHVVLVSSDRYAPFRLKNDTLQSFISLVHLKSRFRPSRHEKMRPEAEVNEKET